MTDSIQTNVSNTSISGQLFGGQNPIVGATISVYAYGTGGYGSSATLLASVTTDSAGSFSFPSGAYTCPQSNTPVYLMSTGGDTGSGANTSATLAAALGSCTQAQSSYVVMNEVTTVAMAYALSHYFNATLGGTAPANDSFGGPVTNSSGTTVYSRGLLRGNSITAGLIAQNQTGYAVASSGNLTTEQQKVYSLANTLAACVNSAGLTGPGDTTSSCGRLFSLTTPSGSATSPTDTLQAAVEIALHPQQNVNNLYLLPNTKVAFANTLATTPSDWSLAVSFTTSSLGLSVDANTLSTLDIDASGRVWFPSNASGQVGVAYFDPTTSTFAGPYHATGLVHPEQVAIDNNGYVWLSDTQGAGVAAYNTASPSVGMSFPLANTLSYSVAVAADSSVRFGLYDSALAKFRLATVPSVSGSLTELATPALTNGYTPYSLAFDNSNNLLVAQFLASTPRFYHSYLTAGGSFTANVDTAADNVGQNVWNGSDLIGLRAFSSISGGAVDGFCFQSAANCYAVKGASSGTGATGMAVDGAKTLWVANQTKISVAAAPLYSGSSYLQSVGGVSQIQTYLYTHNPSNGNTLVRPEGIGIDNEGNVWVSNAGCLTTGCTPGSFVLSEIIGAAAPTVTPLAAQIAGGASLAGTEPAY